MIVRIEKGIVAEIIPKNATPVEDWYGADFAALCVTAPEDVAIGWVYDAETKSFAPPEPVIAPTAVTDELPRDDAAIRAELKSLRDKIDELEASLDDH